MYSEHLSFSQCDNAHLYDLLPIPFREDAVKHIVNKIKLVQDILERPLILENVSYYTAIAPEMSEEEFIKAIIEESQCLLLLDVNNVYVNAFNHQYDPKAFIKNLPLEKVAYIHMAGHEKISDDLIIDTHGEDIIPPVYNLLDFTLSQLKKPIPILLERDFNIPDLKELYQELSLLNKIVEKNYHQSLPSHA
jgi:hypothetical protein